MRDFSLDMYARLLDALRSRGLSTRRFDEIDQCAGQSFAVLRHDVDRLPARALAMARLEAGHGARATYFFRTKRVSFDLRIMREIAALGHEIGYHYECLSDTRGDKEQAWKLFQEELAKFEPVGRVTSIAMHGRPLSVHDNRDLWQGYDYRRVGIEREAYLDLPSGGFAYFTDVGGRWDNFHNRRDYVASADSAPVSVRTTPELIELLRGIDQNPVISTHPERWSSSLLGWVQARSTDLALNTVKRVLLR